MMLSVTTARRHTTLPQRKSTAIFAQQEFLDLKPSLLVIDEKGHSVILKSAKSASFTMMR